MSINTDNFQFPQKDSLYEGALFVGLNTSKNFTSTYFSRSSVVALPLETVLGKTAFKTISRIWEKTMLCQGFFSKEEPLPYFWEKHIASMYKTGWCYGSSLEFIHKVTQNPLVEDIELMKSMKLGKIIVYQAMQGLFRKLRKHGSPITQEKSFLEKFLLKEKIPGNINTAIEQSVELNSINHEIINGIIYSLTETLNTPNCTALRLSVSGSPGHSIACQIYPIMRIYNPADGIYTVETRKKLLSILRSGLENTLQQRKKDKLQNVIITIVNYSSFLNFRIAA